MHWIYCFGLSFLLAAGPASPVAADVRRADPLVVPRGPGPLPERSAKQGTLQRVEHAGSALRDRGFKELPVLAWALLEQAHAGEDGEMVERAVALAPSTPSVRFEAARLSHDPLEFVQSLVLLPRSLPALIWLVTFVGAALGLGLLVAAAMVVAVACGRTLALHGHWFGHRINSQLAPTWPGVLLVLALLAVLGRLGLGPALVLGVAGLLAAMRLRLREAVPVAVALLLLGLLLGPLLSHWARLAAFSGYDRGLFAAWRLDQSQPLPNDRELLAQQLERKPDDSILRLALATAWQREGELRRAEELASRFSYTAARPLQARAANLLGMIHLARGDVTPAIVAFERARAVEESAAVLYNLGQAHGRALALAKQVSFFKLASDMDSELIRRHTLEQSPNLHRTLIHSPIPLLSYLAHGLRDSPEARGLIRESRRWLLGARAPEWAWAALPVLGLLGLAIRAASIRSCEACLGPLCWRCLPSMGSGKICDRCQQLLLGDSKGTAGAPKIGRPLIKRRRRWPERVVVGLSFLLPGVDRIHQGCVLSGASRIFLIATGIAFLILPQGLSLPVRFTLPAPFEVGGLGFALPLLAAFLLLTPPYTLRVLGTVRRRRVLARKTA